MPPIELLTSLVAGSRLHGHGAHARPDLLADALAFTPAAVLAPSSWRSSRPSPLDGAAGRRPGHHSRTRSSSTLAAAGGGAAAAGMVGAALDLQDVYDELGAGDKTPFAIRDFLQAIHGSWAPAPRFCCWSAMPRSIREISWGRGTSTSPPPSSSIPSRWRPPPTTGSSTGTPDAIPGPGNRTAPGPHDGGGVHGGGKILGYGGAANLPRGGLFIAGADEPGLSFEDDSRASAAAVAGLMPTTDFLLSQPSSTEASLLPCSTQGPFLVNYLGHGSVSVWDGLMSAADAAALTNAPLSIYVAMNCLNGFFHDVYTESLAETLIKAPQGGAVAVWASSTLTSFEQQGALDRAFVERLTRTSLGEAAMAAKRGITDVDAQRSWDLVRGSDHLRRTHPALGGGRRRPRARRGGRRRRGARSRGGGRWGSRRNSGRWRPRRRTGRRRRRRVSSVAKRRRMRL